MKRLLAAIPLLLLLAAPPVSAGPDGPTGAEVIRLLDGTLMEKAAAKLAQVPADDRDRPWAEALLQFHYGDYAAADAALPDRDPPPGLEWLPTRIAAAKEVTADFLERTEQNFVYRFHPGADAILVDYAVEALEGQRAAMARVLGVAPQRPIVVEFFPELTSFVAATGLPPEWVETTNTVAICKWDRMMVLSPMNMARGYPWKDTLAHEYVHLVLSRASGNQAPIWFQEGSAKVMESWWRKGPRPGPFELDPRSETMLSAAIGADSLIPFADMHPSMAALPSPEAAGLAFAEVATAIDFILGEVGEAGYRRIVDQTAGHGQIMRAVDATLGLRGGGFEARWERWLKSQPLEKVFDEIIIGVRDVDIETGAAGQRDESGEEMDEVILEERKAEDLVRVGDMLRLRGHVRAALIEYQRAAGEMRSHSPMLANKQARALRDLGELAIARDVLQETVDLYPEYSPTVTLLAELSLKADDPVAAEEYAMQSIGLNPFNPTPHLVLAAIYEEAGREDELQREKTVLSVLNTYVDW